MDELRIEHIPASHHVYAAFFRNLANAAFLQAQLIAKNSDFEYAFIDASSVVSSTHILAAAFKAITNLVDGTLKTPNVHSEIVSSFSPSNNIAEAYRRFGISPDTKDVVVIKVLFPAETKAPSADGLWKHLSEHVQGTVTPMTDESIACCTDVDKVKKYYKLNGAPALAGQQEALKKEVELLILGAMALRGL